METTARPMGANELAALARTLPKAELHVHAEACLEPELLLRIAERNGIELPYASIEEVRQAYAWPDLASFLDRYYRHIDVLRTELDYQELVESYMRNVAEQGVRHVEMFFDPQAHTRRGVALSTVLDGLLAGLDGGRREFGISGALMSCFLRELGVGAAIESLGQLRELAASERVIAVGLDSIEQGFPPPLFAPLYARADELGLRKVIHAGEDAPGENVGLALDVLGVDRVDHGVRCVEEPDVVAELRRRRTPLTTCPFANVRCGIYETIDEHPAAALLRDGLCVTINSDGPAYFGGYVADNWVAVQQAAGLDASELVQLARNSVDASFAGAARKAALHTEIDAAVPAA